MENYPMRKSIRLKSHDYSQNGYYFITMCVQNMKNLLCSDTSSRRGEPCSPAPIPQFQLTNIGLLVDSAIRNIPNCYENVEVDKYVIMPNHIHMIIVIRGYEDGRTRFAPTVGRVVKQTKGVVTKQVGYSIWQKSFYDHVITKELEYQEIWEYIDNNPLKWELDKYYNK